MRRALTLGVLALAAVVLAQTLHQRFRLTNDASQNWNWTKVDELLRSLSRPTERQSVWVLPEGIVPSTECPIPDSGAVTWCIANECPVARTSDGTIHVLGSCITITTTTASTSTSTSSTTSTSTSTLLVTTSTSTSTSTIATTTSTTLGFFQAPTRGST